MTRRTARERIMQMLYEVNFHPEEERDRIICQRLEGIKEEEKGNNKAVIAFIESEYYGVLEHLEEIDALIESTTEKWTISRIAKVDLSLLRLAIYELKYTDIPKKVVVNEAIEIAKVYSTEKAPQFINGILGSVIEKIGA